MKHGSGCRAALVFLILCSHLMGDPQSRSAKPSLDIYEEQFQTRKRVFVTIQAPEIEGVGANLWCYEDRFGQPKRVQRRDGGITLFHEYRGTTLETRFHPEADGVVITAIMSGPEEAVIKEIRFVNMCVTFQRSAAFGNKKDKFDESYLTDFVGRAFVFLPKGLTRLSDTVRIPSVDGRDNPFSARGRMPKPWVQEYIPAWGNRSKWVDTFYGKRPVSTDRPVYPIIGVVSHDRRFLSAIAWPECERLGQLFLSCVHPNPVIADSYDPKTGRYVSRGKIYFLDNNPDRLLQSFKRDFPDWKRPPDGE
ncbi:MAG: hypothetical protein ACE15E_09085 [Acidobacteriota bacterium]